MGYSALPAVSADGPVAFSDNVIVQCFSETGTLALGKALILIDDTGVATTVVVANPASLDWEVNIGGGPSDDDWALRTKAAIELTTPQYTASPSGNSLSITRSDERLFSVFSTSEGWLVVG